MKHTEVETASLALYHMVHCPYCARVRHVIDELNINIPLHDIYTDSVKAKELVANGGKRQVPCLRIETADGKTQWLYESQDIINYLRKQSQHIKDVA